VGCSRLQFHDLINSRAPIGLNLAREKRNHEAGLCKSERKIVPTCSFECYKSSDQHLKAPIKNKNVQKQAQLKLFVRISYVFCIDRLHYFASFDIKRFLEVKEVGEIGVTGRSCTGCYWKEDMCEGRLGSRCGAEWEGYEPKEATEAGGLRTEPGPNSL